MPWGQKPYKKMISHENFSWDFFLVDKNHAKKLFPLKISLGTFFGGNQDPMEEYKQKIALLQNCSRSLQFSDGLSSVVWV